MKRPNHSSQFLAAGLTLAAMTLLLLQALTAVDGPDAARWTPLAGAIVMLFCFALLWSVMVAGFVAAAVASQVRQAVATRRPPARAPIDDVVDNYISDARNARQQATA